MGATDPLGPEAVLLRPIEQTTRTFYLTIAGLVCVLGLGVYAWAWQLSQGLQVTGLNVPVYWGLYITNFVFFIGISHAGTLISAILRICNAEWRRSITRAAEVITVLVLFCGAGNVILDLGHPERALNVIYHPNLRSPLLWDVISITIYLTSSTIYLYLPLIPDIAILRDRMPSRRWFYGPLSLGWTGSDKQVRRLNRAIGFMALLVIPVAISVHTVVSWVFGMTLQAMWHSTIFGPYFVVGALFSGIAAIILVMAVIRRVYGLEKYLKPVHFDNLGKLLLVMTLLWFYFTFSEYLTTWYGNEPSHLVVFYAKVTGEYAVMFWAMVLFCLVIPFTILCNRPMRTITGTVIASISVNIGMWLERYTIVVPTLARATSLSEAGVYAPSWVEWSLMAAFFAWFALIYMVFTKLFPIVSIWEIREGKEHAVREVTERIETYLPDE